MNISCCGDPTRFPSSSEDSAKVKHIKAGPTNASPTYHEKSSEREYLKAQKAELFDQRGDGKSSQMQRSRLTVVAPRPWPRGGGRISRGSCQCSLVFCQVADWFLQWHIAPHLCPLPGNPLNSLQSHLSSLTARMSVYAFSIPNNNRKVWKGTFTVTIQSP